ncbi:MAG: hypothetical protein GX600_01635 [Dehalococcoidia bacterium]|nr:hypothetical protein [Dehalococcoidia bacterium]
MKKRVWIPELEALLEHVTKPILVCAVLFAVLCVIGLAKGWDGDEPDWFSHALFVIAASLSLVVAFVFGIIFSNNALATKTEVEAPEPHEEKQ